MGVAPADRRAARPGGGHVSGLATGPPRRGGYLPRPIRRLRRRGPEPVPQQAIQWLIAGTCGTTWPNMSEKRSPATTPASNHRRADPAPQPAVVADLGRSPLTPRRRTPSTAGWSERTRSATSRFSRCARGYGHQGDRSGAHLARETVRVSRAPRDVEDLLTRRASGAAQHPGRVRRDLHQRYNDGCTSPPSCWSSPEHWDTAAATAHCATTCAPSRHCRPRRPSPPIHRRFVTSPP